MSDQPAFAETLAGAQDGEEWAVGVIWRAHQPALLRFLRVRHSDQDVDDVASDVWLRVSRSLDRFRGSETQFRSWFFSLARAASVDWYRRAGRTRERLLDDVDAPDVSHTGDPESAALESLSTAAALRLVAALPMDQAEIIALRVIAGLDTERVAEIVGKRPGTVRVLQHRGLRRLAQLLQEQGIRRGVTQ